MESVLLDPLRGKTSLRTVFWGYGVVPSIVLSLLQSVVDPADGPLWTALLAVSVLVSCYQLAALWQCAPNAKSAFVRGFTRASVIVSVLLLPVLIYLLWQFPMDAILS